MLLKNKRLKPGGFIFDIFLLFIMIFGIDLPVLNSTYISFGIILVVAFSDLNTIKFIFYFFKNKYFLKILTLYFFLLVFIFLSTSFHHAYDFILFKTIFNTMINFVFCGVFSCYFLSRGYNIRKLLKLIIIVFVIQSIIEICSLLSPNVLAFVQSFHSDIYVVEKLRMHGARKGLALSGSIFFALSSVFGFVFVFYGRYLSLVDKNIYNIILGIILSIGAVLSGRTAFVGIVFGFLVIFFLNDNYNKKIIFPAWLKGIILLLLTLLIGNSLLSDETKNNVLNLSQYFFEFAYSYLEDGNLNTTSTEGMFKMYFLPEFKTLLIGDGFYNSLVGNGYYMGTDIGYMRNILFFGLFGLFYMIYMQYYMLFKFKPRLTRNELKFSGLVFLYLLIIHGKGEVLVYLVMLHRILFLYFIFSSFYYKNQLLQESNIRIV